MSQASVFGLILIIFSGLWIGGSGWPIKLMPHYAYEHIGLISNLVGLIIGPWAITLIFCPHAFEAYRSVGFAILLKSNLFSLSWGVANVLCLMCYLRIGFSLTGGILVGTAIPIGVLTPMVFKASGLFSKAPSLISPAGLIVLAGALVMLVGVLFAVCSGYGRDQALKKISPVSQKIGAGLLMAFLAGVLSVGNSFAFVYSQGPIVRAMEAHGAKEIAANFAVWSMALLAGGIVNILVPIWYLQRKKNWHIFWAHPFELFLCLIGGLQGCLLYAIMGKGMVFLGTLGASVGFGVSQAMQMVGGQIVGFAWGEWRGVPGKPRRQIIYGMIILIVAVAIMALGNSVTTSHFHHES